MSDVETIKSKQPSVDLYTYNADHGFQCDERDSFAPEAAQIVWAAPCASSTAICKMIVSDNGTELTSRAAQTVGAMQLMTQALAKIDQSRFLLVGSRDPVRRQRSNRLVCLLGPRLGRRRSRIS